MSMQVKRYEQHGRGDAVTVVLYNTTKLNTVDNEKASIIVPDPAARKAASLPMISGDQ